MDLSDTLHWDESALSLSSDIHILEFSYSFMVMTCLIYAVVVIYLWSLQ